MVNRAKRSHGMTRKGVPRRHASRHKAGTQEQQCMVEVNMAHTSSSPNGSILDNTISPKVSEEEDKPDASAMKKAVRKIVDYFQEFCDSSSLHGLQYFGKQKRPYVERICWFIVIIASLAFCSLVINRQWNKWQTSPVIVSFSETSTQVWKIPFPAVTICSEVKFKQSELNYTYMVMKHMRKNATEEELNSLQYTSLLCNVPFLGGPQYIHNAKIEYLTKIAPQVKDLFKVCTWRAAQVDCEEVFTPIINHHGNCFTFNSLAAEQLFTSQAVQKLSSSGNLSRHWDPEGGYEVSDDRKETYPRRSSAGLLAGLYISLRSEIESEGDPNCRVPMEGFKVMLHNPAVFPQVRQPFFQIPSKRQVMVWIKPEMMETDDHLRSYTPADRRCYFQKERILRYFNVYTQESCELECISNYTMKKCGCVMFYMPRSSDMPVCGSTKAPCVVKGLIQHHTEHDGHCQCLPACTEIKYGMQMSQAKYKWEQADRLYKIPGSLAVAFQDTEIISSKRGELYGAADFIANCGGLLGLFLGFSILSLVEIVYFLTLRPCCNLIQSSAAKNI